MNFVGMLLIVAGLGYAELPALMRQRAYREAAVIIVILLLGAGLGIAYAGELPLPTVSRLIQRLFGPLVQIR